MSEVGILMVDAAEPLRCLVTNNVCGTDTQRTCECPACQLHVKFDEHFADSTVPDPPEGWELPGGSL
jgi:hypothetical protein